MWRMKIASAALLALVMGLASSQARERAAAAGGDGARGAPDRGARYCWLAKKCSSCSSSSFVTLSRRCFILSSSGRRPERKFASCSFR